MLDIPYGDGNFENIRNENLIYIDKTMYIEKLEQGSDRKKTVYLRPRRFGKSLFTSMLTCYYSVDMKDKFENLFKGLYIYDNPTKNKNNYYVLNFDFSGMTIMDGNVVEEGKRAFYSSVELSIREFINRYKLPIEIKGATASELLANLLVDFKGLYLENKIYIIVDEYDNFTNAILKGDAKDFLDLVNRNGYVRAFYEVIKTKLQEGVVERFFATGVMPVTLDNLTSGFNIATNLSTDLDFTSMIGFTHDEVKDLLQKIVPEEDRDKVFKDLEENYDGYRFSPMSNEKTFNSTLVLYYLKNYIRLKQPPEKLIDVNLNTSGDKIKRITELVNSKLNISVIQELLLKNEVSAILQDVVLLEKFNKNTYLTMLFYLGYLTIKEHIGKTILTIPNYAMATVYAEYFAGYLEEKTNYEIDTTRIEDAIEVLGESGNIMPIVQLVQEFLRYASNRDMENFDEKNLKYVFTLFLQLSRQYIVYGEFPANQGFVDIFVAKSSSSMAKYESVIELKYMPKKEGKRANKKKLVTSAKEQLEYYIKDKRLEQRENLKKYAIIFSGFEDVLVEEV
ncbi:MAG: AAA family ATPase [Clostridia bacterium]|nr:AAA family ATPase [Clostridia bacterium]